MNSCGPRFPKLKNLSEGAEPCVAFPPSGEFFFAARIRGRILSAQRDVPMRVVLVMTQEALRNFTGITLPDPTILVEPRPRVPPSVRANLGVLQRKRSLCFFRDCVSNPIGESTAVARARSWNSSEVAFPVPRFAMTLDQGTRISYASTDWRRAILCCIPATTLHTY